MPSNPDLQLSLFPRRWSTSLFMALVMWFGMGGPAPAQAPYADEETTEGWAWAQIKQGKAANLNDRCKTPALDPRAENEARWTDGCRRISAAFLVDVLMHEPWREQVPYLGVAIIGGRLEGDIDLRNAKLNRAISISQSRIENDVHLEAARTDSVIGVSGSRVAGRVSAAQLHCELSLRLSGSEFKQDVLLNNAKIDDYLDMSGATFAGNLNANSLQVGAHLLMGASGPGKAGFRNVNLVGARVTGNVDMDGATFDGNLNAGLLQVGASLFMRSTEQNKAIFKNVNLASAKVTGNVDMEGATFDGDLYADTMKVEGALSMNSTMQNKASFKGVNLVTAKVTGDVEMEGATFDGQLDAEALKVEGSVYMLTSSFVAPVIIASANIGGNLDLRGATFVSLDLAGSVISGDLRLGRYDEVPSTIWKNEKGGPGGFALHNTRVANLVDAQDAWPSPGHIDLDGFGFARLGGLDGDSAKQMRDRGTDWWDSWIRRDPKYSPAPYEQLAAAFVAMGDRDAADEIHYLGRVRQRETETRWWPWIISGLFQYTAGFGIGIYTFRVVWWVIGISVAGAVYLWTCVAAARRQGAIWCFGASLARLLPVIEINKEFTDFFNDPHRKRLTARQSLVFSAIGMLGWLLGAILIAAVSGLTQKP
jgi:hypothetical protein